MTAAGTGDTRPRVVIIGAGYAGYHCDIVIVSPTDYMPYLSLLPEVGAGIVDPRHIAVSLAATLRRARLVAGPDGQRRELGWDRLVIAPGSVSRTLRLPGVLDHAGSRQGVQEPRRGWRPRSRRSPAGGSGSPTAPPCPPTRWSGASA
jgi:NADH dehydrogenase